MRILRFLSTLVALAGSLVPLQAQAPLWLTDIMSAYPPATHLAFVGTGRDLESARQDAMVQMSRYFGVSVDALVEGSRLFAETDKTSGFRTSLAETVKVRTRQDLFALRFTDPFVDSRGTWICAWSLKSELAENLAWTIENLYRRLDSLLAGIDPSGPPLNILARSGAAAVLVDQIEASVRKLALIDQARSRTLQGHESLDRGFEAWESARSRHPLVVTVQGDQGGKAIAKLKSLLAADGFVIGTKGPLRVEADLQWADKNLSPGVQTIEWTFTVRVRNEAGEELMVAGKTGRDSGASRDAALIRAAARFDTFAASDFMPAWHGWFASLVN